MPTWNLTSPTMQRTLTLEPESGLKTTAWINRRSGVDYLAWAHHTWQHGEEFALHLDGVPVSSSEARLDLIDAAASASTLHVRLALVGTPLEITCHYELDADFPACRKWLTLTNTGAVPIRLTQLVIESAVLASGPPGTQTLQAGYGINPRELLYSGRVEDMLFVQRHIETGEGFAALNGAPGYCKKSETLGWAGGFRLGYDTDLFPFERSLAPGESFTSAVMTVLWLGGDDTPDSPRCLLPAYTNARLRRHAAPRPFIYNTWEGFFEKINAATVEALIPIAAQMGMDCFAIDDGWQTAYGDNAVSPARFPAGLEPLRQQIEAAGMRLGLWVPLTVVAEDSAVYQQHPEWLCRDGRGQIKQTRTAWGMRPIMCLASDYRAAAAQRLIDLVGRYHVQYLKIDLTSVFNAYGEAPGCHTPGHHHQSWEESLSLIYEGMRWVCEQIYAAQPDVLIDLTFELWGHKHIIDYGLLAAADFDWLSNAQDKLDGYWGPVQARTLLYQRALAVPTESLLIGNLEATREPIADRFATTIASSPLLLGDLRQLTPAQIAWYRQHMDWFKALRREVALDQTFIPLGNWMQPRQNQWDGYARLSLNGEGLLAIFPNASGVESVELRLPAQPDGTYQLRPPLETEPPLIFSGRELRAGVRLTLPAGAVGLWAVRVSEA
ncbi:MAG: alpha-galactosidase [Anaerolineae bacterium]|nr:alpha-galactosidase [Anaerolineae bacterium]